MQWFIETWAKHSWERIIESKENQKSVFDMTTIILRHSLNVLYNSF